MAKIDLSVLKSLSKEQRTSFASRIRKNPELWNVFNGIGGLSENSENGLIHGNTTFKGAVLPVVDVTLKNSNNVEKKTKTNQYGFFKMELVPGLYLITFSKGNTQSVPKEINIVKGITIYEDYDFENL